MKIGYTVWTWLRDSMNDWETFGGYAKRDFEQALREISDLGYSVFENFNILVKMYEGNPKEFDALVAKYGLKFVNIYHYLTGDFDADMKLAEKCCKFIKDHGANLVNIQAPWWPQGGTTQKDVVDVTEKLMQMGRLVHDYGVTLCLHPHYGTTVYYEHEIDYVISHIDAKLLSLTMDTAHTILAGMDPATAFTKYISRIKYIHLKDVDPTFSKEEPMTGFRTLGYGIVNFRNTVDALKKSGYDGVLMVEVDNPPICNYHTAMISRKYIHDVLEM